MNRDAPHSKTGIAVDRAGPLARSHVNGATPEILPADQHRRLFEESPHAIILSDTEGRIVDLNSGALRLLRYARGALLNQSLAAVVEFGPDFAAEAGTRFVTHGYWEGEVGVRTSDGETLPLDAHGHIVHHAGEVLTVTVLRDLTERKRDHLAQARLAALVRSSADAVIGLTLDAIVTDWNPAAERLYGYTAEEMIGQPLVSVIAQPNLARTEAVLERARHGESVEGIEFSRLTRDGRPIDIALTVSPVWDDAGEIIAISAIVRDFSERKATERALAASEQRFRVAFQDAPAGMVLSAPNGSIVLVNRAICQMLGYSQTELLASSLRELTHPEDIPKNQVLADRMMAGELDTFELEKRYIHRDGSIVWATLNASLVRDEQGQPELFISQMQDITARKLAEERLAAADQQVGEVLARITDAYVAFDREWRPTFVNAAAEVILGCSREDLLGKVIWDEFAPAMQTPLFAACQQAMTEGRNLTVEYFYPPFDSWYEARLYPWHGGLSVFARDITETRRLTQNLRASETRYRTLVERAPIVVYQLAADEAQTRLYFSPRVEDLTGFTPEEALALARKEHWLTFVHPADRERVAAADRVHQEMGGVFRVEYRTARKDGGYVWVRDECVPVYDDADQIVAWQGVLQDISERIAAEETQARLAAIVESTDVAIISRTLDGTITSWNRGAERLYGFTAEQMIGQPLASILPPDDPNSRLVSAEELADHPVEFEATRYRDDGSALETAVSLSPIRDRNGIITGVSSITQDITARKRAEDELRAALEAAEAGIRTKTLFLAMMSHELRTPLQAVLGYADFLLASPTDTLTPEQRDDIGYIRQGASRMVTLIEQLLDLSRMEAGRLELASEPVDTREILEQVRQDIAPQAREKGLDFTIILPAALPMALGDADRVRQILLNLAGNAVKFTEQGAITITASVTRRAIQITVRDTGAGIAAEALPYIFEEFRQVDGNLTRRHGGAGLGLAISQRLAEQMGGHIGVESAPGTGSAFTLNLPAAPRRRKAAGPRQPDNP